MASSTSHNLSRNLVDARKRSGLTLKALSERSGVSERTISALVGESSSSPSIKTVERLAQALGVNIADLFGEDALKLDLPTPTSKVARDLGRLIEDFLVSSAQGRRRIANVAADEAEKAEK